MPPPPDALHLLSQTRFGPQHHADAVLRVATSKCRVAIWVALLLSLTSALAAQAQPSSSTTLPPARLDAAFADPLVDFDATLTALRVSTWEDAPPPGADRPAARMLLLEEDAVVQVGAYGFRADRAVVRLEFEQADRGRVTHLAALLINPRPIAGGGTIRASGGDLLLTASTLGKLTLEKPGSFTRLPAAPSDPLIPTFTQRLIAHRTAAAGPGLRVPDLAINRGLPEDVELLRQRRRAEIAQEQRRFTDLTPPADAPDTTAAAPPGTDGDGDPFAPQPAASILPARGAVVYSMDSWSAQIGEDEIAVSLLGDVRIVFEDYANDRIVTLRAQKVVLFIDPDATDDAPTAQTLGNGQLDAGALRGIYLEDNAIVSDGQYTVRSPRMYYDLARDRATLLDAVFYTYDERRGTPLYVRARAVRQTSASDFRASGARLTTSEFAVPHFSIGAGELDFQQYRTAAGQTGAVFRARDTTLKVGNTPVFYWPYLAGYARDIPLKSLNVSYSSDIGVAVETNWDLFALLGKPNPDNVEAEFELDYLGEHGPAIGVNGSYRSGQQRGFYRGYFLADDSGTDTLPGRSVEQTDAQRGIALARHRADLPDNLTLSLEGAYVSDPTFLEEFFPDQAAASKPLETSAYLKWQEADQAFEALAVTDFSNFIENLDQLQSTGTSVERYPELTYRVIGGQPLPGLTWFSQTQVSQLRLRAFDDAPEDRGFSDRRSQEAFGIDADTSFNDRAEALNLPLDSVRRLDSRQELSLPLVAGPLNVTPYAVGRVTAYDDDFSEFNGGNDDQVRLYGEAGLRLGTSFARADASARSALLDLDGLRHVVEPSATFFLNGSTIDPDDLPVYDPDVESLAQGAGVRVGVLNTWQTRRGGPGRQRTVDWVTLQTDLVLRSDDADVDDPLPVFYDYRPELARGGDHFYTELLWMVTDTLGVAGQLTHSLEADRVAQWRVGGTLDHNPQLRSFVAYQEIDVFDTRLLTYGFTYQLTLKYQLGFRQTLDFSENESRNIRFYVDRQLPGWTFRVNVAYDQIDEESRIGFTLIPDGGRASPSIAFGGD